MHGQVTVYDDKSFCLNIAGQGQQPVYVACTHDHKFLPLRVGDYVRVSAKGFVQQQPPAGYQYAAKLIEYPWVMVNMADNGIWHCIPKPRQSVAALTKLVQEFGKDGIKLNKLAEARHRHGEVVDLKPY